MKPSGNFIAGLLMTVIFAFFMWQIKQIVDSAYQRGVEASDAAWQAALAKTEAKAAKSALETDTKALEVARHLREKLAELEAENAELAKQNGSACGFDADHVRLLNRQTAD